jgi:hypothetical protein
LTAASEARQIALGFLPSGAKDLSDEYKMINARAESVAEAGLPACLREAAVSCARGWILNGRRRAEKALSHSVAI